jgi:Na+/H+ antiporter NhaC
MDFDFNATLFIGTILSFMLSIIAWFIRQLHQDFRNMQKEVNNLQQTANAIQLETRSSYELIELKIGFLKWRLDEKEKPLDASKKEKNEKSS